MSMVIWTSACCGYLLGVVPGDDGPLQVCDWCKTPTHAVPMSIGDDPADYTAFLARPIHRADAAQRRGPFGEMG